MDTAKENGVAPNMTEVRRKYANSFVIGLGALYILAVLYFTLFWRSGGWIGRYELRLNLIPFYWIWEPMLTDAPFSPAHVLLNILLFVPLGVLLGKSLPMRKLGRTALAALTFSLCIELIQPLFGRITDVDDLLLNVIGAVLGYLSIRLLQRVWRNVTKVFAKCKANRWLKQAIFGMIKKKEVLYEKI